MTKRLISILLAGVALHTHAQTVWTYADCVDYARAHNIDLQKSILGQLTAGYDLEEAKAQWQPTLDFATTQGFTNSPWASGEKNVYSGAYGLNAGWTVWNGGQRENTIRRNELLTEVSELNTTDVFRTLETDLLQVYLNILYARDAITIYEEAEKLSAANADRAQQLMEAGRISRVDYAQLASQHEQDTYALVNARATYETRCMELKKLLQLGIDTSVSLSDVTWSDATVLAQLPPMDESYRMAIDTDVRLKSLGLLLEGSELDVKIAKASGLPSINLSAGVSTAYGAPGPAFGEALKQSLNEHIGLTLNVPILNNKKTKMAVARANVDRLNAQLDIDQRLLDLGQSVENWYIDTQSAQSRYTAAAAQLESAEVSSELTNAQFELGLLNTVELMTAHSNLINARQTLLQAKYMAMLGQKMVEYYRTASVAIP